MIRNFLIGFNQNPHQRAFLNNSFSTLQCSIKSSQSPHALPCNHYIWQQYQQTKAKYLFPALILKAVDPHKVEVN